MAKVRNHSKGSCKLPVSKLLTRWDILTLKPETLNLKFQGFLLWMTLPGQEWHISSF